MTNKYGDKTNNEIKTIIKQLEYDYISLKNNLLKMYDNMVHLEKESEIAIKELLKRQQK